MQYSSSSHKSPTQAKPDTAVLLINLGTPDAPTRPAIRKYLKEFLSDPRVVETPKFIWWFILNCIILVFRPAKLVKNYQLLWKEGDSPIRLITRQQEQKLQGVLNKQYPGTKVYSAMTYGNPSISSTLTQIQKEGIEKIVVLPLYPQYSATTTAAAWDVLSSELQNLRNIPGIHFIKRYHQHPAYIQALANSVKEHWEQQERQGTLLMSFHGIPKAYIEKGDPYATDCKETANLLAEALGLSSEQWTMTFQSRVGKAEWLTPYTDQTMSRLGTEQTQGLDVICPGFSADCLETLEEIDEENREIFEEAGGKDFHYIPALNARDDHIEALAAIISPYLA